MSKENNKLTRSDELFLKAKAVIPGGIFGHYKYSVGESAPKFFSKAKDSYFWDVDGNKFIDLMCAYGPCLLYTSPSPRDATLSRMPSSA